MLHYKLCLKFDTLNSLAGYSVRVEAIFSACGAEAIVMSLWKVPDKETSEMMDNFYRNSLDGMTKQEALHQASMKLLNNLRDRYSTAYPLLWGGFVLEGNPN